MTFAASAAPGLRPPAALFAVALLLVPTAAFAQGVGPSKGPLPAGVPERSATRPWFVQFDLRGALAGTENVIGLNELQLDGDSRVLTGARFLLSGRAGFGRQVDTRVIKGVFGFAELISTHGTSTDRAPDGWSTEQVAWVQYLGAGVLLPDDWWLYVEGQGHWSFAGDTTGGPYEIYNMVLAGRAFDFRFGDEQRWFVRGHLEGGISWSHNEVSVNLRRFDQPETEFFGDTYGRYALRGTVHVGARVDRSVFREASFYANPYFIFGRTIPQQEYTWEVDYIGTRRSIGGQMTFDNGLRAFMEYQLDWHLGDTTATPAGGPYESYFVLGAVKVFDWNR